MQMNAATLRRFDEHKDELCRRLVEITKELGGRPPRLVQVTESTYLKLVREVVKGRKVVRTGKKDGTDREWKVGPDGFFHLCDEPNSLLLPDTAVRSLGEINALSNSAKAQERARAAGKNYAMKYTYDASGRMTGAHIGDEFLDAKRKFFALPGFGNQIEIPLVPKLKPGELAVVLTWMPGTFVNGN